jgi:hypothetical protein
MFISPGSKKLEYYKNKEFSKMTIKDIFSFQGMKYKEIESALSKENINIGIAPMIKIINSYLLSLPEGKRNTILNEKYNFNSGTGEPSSSPITFGNLLNGTISNILIKAPDSIKEFKTNFEIYLGALPTTPPINRNNK